jgi:hypothetical protein
LETAVATLLLVVASVVLACTVITYAVATIEQSVNTQNVGELGSLQKSVNIWLNDTGIGNVTQPQLPTPTP